jgi:hypothetical protein
VISLQKRNHRTGVALPMERPRVVIESPLSGDFLKNRRYATWCCRYMHEAGFSPLASHLVAPWFMDDRDAVDRAAGIDMPWFWLPDVPHHFFTDFGMSSGMVAALDRCRGLGISTLEEATLPPHYLQLFLDGEWPAHTPGFGPDAGLVRGWCDPDNENYDAALVEQADREADEWERALSPDEGTTRTVDMLESLREVLRPKLDTP